MPSSSRTRGPHPGFIAPPVGIGLLALVLVWAADAEIALMKHPTYGEVFPPGTYAWSTDMSEGDKHLWQFDTTGFYNGGALADLLSAFFPIHSWSIVQSLDYTVIVDVLSGDADLHVYGPVMDKDMRYQLNPSISEQSQNYAGADTALSAMTELRRIDLSRNMLSGTFADLMSLATRLPHLEALKMSANQLSGKLVCPNNDRQLASLKILDVSSNGIEPASTGPGLPACLLSLPQLEILNLSNNSLVGGGLPPSFRANSKLVSLNIGSQKDGGGVGGRLPPLAPLRKLTAFRAAGAGFTGPVPQLPAQLQVVDLSGNGFTGDLRLQAADSAGRRAPSSLRALDLSGNALTGPLPATLLSDLPQLRRLNLSRNALYGTIPDTAWVAAAGELTSIDLSANPLSGTFPSSFGRLPALRLLNLTRTGVAGTLADFFDHLPPYAALQVLDLSGNEVTGGLPASGLAKLPLFAHHSVPGNRGGEPSGGDAALMSLDVSNNSLNGSFPTAAILSAAVDPLSGQLRGHVNLGGNAFLCVDATEMAGIAHRLSSRVPGILLYSCATPSGEGRVLDGETPNPETGSEGMNDHDTPVTEMGGSLAPGRGVDAVTGPAGWSTWVVVIIVLACFLLVVVAVALAVFCCKRRRTNARFAAYSSEPEFVVDMGTKIPANDHAAAAAAGHEDVCAQEMVEIPVSVDTTGPATPYGSHACMDGHAASAGTQLALGRSLVALESGEFDMDAQHIQQAQMAVDEPCRKIVDIDAASDT
eukprot:jgi/Tetstr1/440485/TSEL_028811.t1